CPVVCSPGRCPPVAVALARKRMAGEKVEGCSGLEFDVVELADTMGWQCYLVKRGLRQLQWGSGEFVCVCVCACVCVCGRVCVCVWRCVCVCVCVEVGVSGLCVCVCVFLGCRVYVCVCVCEKERERECVC